jgi:uncharacterized metal-binding protein
MLTLFIGIAIGAVAAVVSPVVYRVVKDAVARAKTKFDGL